MTLKEAIRILDLVDDPLQLKTRKETVQAAKLGIEALKFRKLEKEAGYLDEDDLLPGETKED